MAPHKKRCSVLVTGGAGFLGQHIIELLQTRAHHVTEIRVLDMVPYVRKLEHPDAKPVRQFTGSILDVNLVREACTGVHSVLHIASVIDTSLLPDEKKSYDINVIGTQNIIDACKQAGVKRLIYCSTMDVVIGEENIYNGTEIIPPPEKTLFEPYGATKSKAEQTILSANDVTFTTLSIRPAVMYGEHDYQYMGRVLKVAERVGGYFRFGCKNGKMMHVYVGNVAWCFVCAENVLNNDPAGAKRVGGHAFFVGDETPRKSLSEFHDIFFKSIGIKPFPVSVPCWLVILGLYMMYFILSLISLVHRVNVNVSPSPFKMMTRIHFFSYNKAKTLLNYKPLYTFEEAKARSIMFLASY